MYHRHAHFDTPLPYKTASSKKQTKHTKHTWSLSLANATSVSLNQKIFAKVFVRGCSSNGRARALHARGTGIDTLLLHILFFVGFPDKTTAKGFEHKTTARGFEPLRAEPSRFQICLLNHSFFFMCTGAPVSCCVGIFSGAGALFVPDATEVALPSA